MGHREDLLAGAKRCLLEKGWSRTTARDIVAASGANLASIGYHYGSKDALMREALFAAMGEWADDVERSLREEVRSPEGPGAAAGSAAEGSEAGQVARFEVGWTRMLELFGKHQALWRAQLEAVMRAEGDPELRAAFGQAQPEGRKGLVALFHGILEDEVDEESARILGSFYMTLVGGMAVQMAIDPDGTPGAGELTEAMRRIVTGPTSAPAD
ncbi:putative transcriptional regulator, TetR family protein [Streptomyces bingchenggensis BCW-1]|uniref:Putative transcriptional regulator, TetR family protein n=1 Tax=Streptomyces bingchenggensis (strain BCW-1) TaxID=749414 RepID=D7CCE1_STRBB|nr:MULTISPECIES: TetR/AcrR family transcriptional regulator [Streptomyces]ADI06660.1 putative transcriptional regulator, TetR family protein [Streptomyces bingchenggensis BCW-1]